MGVQSSPLLFDTFSAHYKYRGTLLLPTPMFCACSLSVEYNINF